MNEEKKWVRIMKRILHLFWIGIVTGTIFGLLLKGIQAISGKKVYTLLLNVDYIPWFRDRVFHEFVEFSFHLIISIVVVFVLYWLFKKTHMENRIMPYVFANGFIAFMLFTTTALSDRTPDVLDAQAFGFWLVGHIIYGFLMAKCIQKTVENEAE